MKKVCSFFNIVFDELRSECNYLEFVHDNVYTLQRTDRHDS